MSSPSFKVLHQPVAPRAIVMLLHGGQQESHESVSRRHSSWLRMYFLGRATIPWAKASDLAVVLVKYRERGWNDPRDPDPVRDARWALQAVPERFGELPIVLVGHSMGGRTVCRVADDNAVEGVVALAPWLPEDEPNAAVAGKRLRVVHGTADRWTSPHASKDFVERSQGIAESATWTAIPDVGHFMLSRVSEWNRFVKDSVSEILGLVDIAEATGQGTE